jgi:ankyrin repeat protein
MLRHFGMIETMLDYSANVSKSFPCRHDQITNLRGGESCKNCWSRGALQCALLQDPRDHRLDTRIFSLLLARSEKINFETLGILMSLREEDFLLEAVTKFAHACHKDWHMEWKHVCIWKLMIGSLTQETTALSLLHIMEGLGVTRTTQMLNAAARRGHETVVQEMLAENIALDKYTLYSAITSENVALVRHLLGCGATVNDSSPSGNGDPFSAAVITKNDDLIQLMVDNKALDRRGQWRPRPFAWKAAVAAGNISLLQWLLTMREDIPEYDLGCALTMVAEKGNYDMALQLLERGADIEAISNEANYARDTALMNALKAKNPSLIDLLLHWGANPLHKNPMYPAVVWGNGSVIEKLLAAGATWSASASNEAVKKKDLDLMERLLYARANMRGALEVATQHETVDVCSWLLSHGADPHNSRALYNAYRHKSPSFGALLQSYKVRYPLGA